MASREIKSGASAIGSKLAKHFYDTTGLKCTKAEFMRGVGNVKALLIAEYTEEQIKDAIDWCVKNRPQMTSLGYIVTIINDILFKVKLEKMNVEIRQQDPLLFMQKPIDSPQENTNKDKIKVNRRVRGT